MNLIELDRALKQLRLGGMAAAGDPPAPGPNRTARPHRSALLPRLRRTRAAGRAFAGAAHQTKRSSAIRRRPSITSTSLSIRR